MSVEDFESQVAAAFKEIAPAARLDPAFAYEIERVARRRNNRRLAAGAAGLTVLALAGISFALPWNRNARPDMVPPSVDRDAVHLIVTPAVVPPAGGEVALIAANPTPTQAMYGVNGTVDRWDGHTWQFYGGFASSLDFWGGSGAILPGDPNPPTRTIGLTARGGGYGPLEWLTISNLPAGWYRIGHGTMYGLLEVRPDADKPPQVRPTVPAFLVTSPTVRSGQLTDLRAHATVRGGKDAPPSTRGRVPVEKLVGSRWVTLATVATDDRPDEIVGNTGEFVVLLPALDTGVHRITRDSTAGTLSGVFWVLP
ncbi:hypothetical protein ACWEOZ_04530 [Actinoplanes sp. NPDC004185]